MKVRQSTSDFDERSTVIAAQQGDREAFRSLYDRYRDRVYNFIFYSMGDEMRAEDVLQIVFVKIYRGLPSFRFEASLSTWIYRIALNECLNQQRQHAPCGAGTITGHQWADPPARARKRSRRLLERPRPS